MFRKWGSEQQESKFFFPSGAEGREGRNGPARSGTRKKKISFLVVKSPIFENDSKRLFIFRCSFWTTNLGQKKKHFFSLLFVLFLCFFCCFFVNNSKVKCFFRQHRNENCHYIKIDFFVTEMRKWENSKFRSENSKWLSPWINPPPTISRHQEECMFSVYSAFLLATVWWGRRIVHLEIRGTIIISKSIFYCLSPWINLGRNAFFRRIMLSL